MAIDINEAFRFDILYRNRYNPDGADSFCIALILSYKMHGAEGNDNWMV